MMFLFVVNSFNSLILLSSKCSEVCYVMRRELLITDGKQTFEGIRLALLYNVS